MQTESLAQRCSRYSSSPPVQPSKCIHKHTESYSPPFETWLSTHKKRHTNQILNPWHQLNILIHIENHLTSNNDVLLSICLYLFYGLSIGFRVPLYEDYGPLKSKCPCLTWLKWLLLFASWVRPHFTISERCPGRHKTNEKSKVFKGEGCCMMCQSLGIPMLLCTYSISFCLPFVQLCEAIRNPQVQASLLNTLQMAVSFYFRLDRYSRSFPWLRHETRVLCYSLLFLHPQRDASSMPLWSYVEYTHLQQTLACGQLKMYFIQHHASVQRNLTAAQHF